MVKVYQALSSALNARQSCIKSNNIEWRDKHQEQLDAIMKTAPQGSGIDTCLLLRVESTSGCLQIRISFHHMNENGYYDGWSHHILKVKPSLQFGFKLILSGKNKNNIKGYLHEMFDAWLLEEIINIRKG